MLVTTRGKRREHCIRIYNALLAWFTKYRDMRRRNLGGKIDSYLRFCVKLLSTFDLLTFKYHFGNYHKNLELKTT